MHKRLIGFLNDQKVLYKKQFGFQKDFSTAHAVIGLIENIEKAIDNNSNIFQTTRFNHTMILKKIIV